MQKMHLHMTGFLKHLLALGISMAVSLYHTSPQWPDTGGAELLLALALLWSPDCPVFRVMVT